MKALNSMGRSTELWDALFIAVSQLHSELHSLTLVSQSNFPHFTVYSVTLYFLSLQMKTQCETISEKAFDLHA